MPSAVTISGPKDTPVSAVLYPATSGPDPLGLLVLAHGAGAGQSSDFIRDSAAALATGGLAVLTFDFPYVTAGRRSPDRTAVLVETFARVMTWAEEHDARLFIGGKSMGGRLATHLAADAAPVTLRGVVVFGYPLKPPARRGSAAPPDRVSHLRHLTVPTLIVQGTRDQFGGPADIHSALQTAGVVAPIEIAAVEGADHSFGVQKSSGRDRVEVHAQLMNTAIAWVKRR